MYSESNSSSVENVFVAMFILIMQQQRSSNNFSRRSIGLQNNEL